MLSRYVALVKNLRGLVLLDPNEPEIEEFIDWISHRFRYRNVGVPPALVGQARKLFEGYLRGSPFTELAYPVEELKKLVNSVTESLRVDPIISEALVLASAYVSPIITLGDSLKERLESLSADSVNSKVELDNKDWRLHLRIADYTVLDFYQWSSEHARLLWEPTPPLDAIVRERKSRIQKDKKRYWRLQRGDVEPKLFLLYLDLVCSIAELALNGDRLALDELVKLPKEEASAGLAITAAVLVSRSELSKQP